MTTPGFIRDLRTRVGHALLVLPSVSALVRDEDARLLLIRHANDGLWTVPGGCVEPDEAPERAVAREVREETGLTVTTERLVAVGGGPQFRVQYRNGDEVSYVTAVFECRILRGKLAADEDEVLEARFVEAAELPRFPLSRFGRGVLAAAGWPQARDLH